MHDLDVKKLEKELKEEFQRQQEVERERVIQEKVDERNRKINEVLDDE